MARQPNRNPGVVWDKHRSRWRARVHLGGGKQVTVGTYVSEQDAARARARFLRQIGREA